MHRRAAWLASAQRTRLAAAGARRAWQATCDGAASPEPVRSHTSRLSATVAAASPHADVVRAAHNADSQDGPAACGGRYRAVRHAGSAVA